MTYYKKIEKEMTDSMLRGEYIKKKFSEDNSISTFTFIEKIKDAYYKYDADVYQSGYLKMLRDFFTKEFKNIQNGLDIVDIGAGTGETYSLIEQTKYSFNHYYFIEPFKDMSDKFNREIDNLTIINEYFENINKPLSNEKGKIFILCGVLRTMESPVKFLKKFREMSNKGDLLILGIEPNNRYFSIHNKLWKFRSSIISVTKKIFFLKKYSKKFSSNKKSKSIENAINYLKKKNIVGNKFKWKHLYAIVNYNNLHSWRDIDLPNDNNEGFFDIQLIQDMTHCKLVSINTKGMFYEILDENNFIEKLTISLFPRHGSYFSAIFERK